MPYILYDPAYGAVARVDDPGLATGEQIAIPCEAGADPNEQARWAQEAAQLNDTQRLAVAHSQKLAEIKRAAAAALNTLSAEYPRGEVDSWPQQVKEAEAYSLDSTSPATLLQAIATARGLDLAELVARVNAKTASYALASGQIIGKRQALEDAIDAATTLAELEAIRW